MSVMSRCAPAVYTAGEEVVVRLSGVEVLNLERGVVVPAALLPAWTIATVCACGREDGKPAAYALCFDHWGEPCICAAPEASIEGLA